MNTKQRYCKTCSTKVDKGKSYCSKECRPSFYKYHFKQRYCKTCNIKVGKGKSYCSDSCRPSDYAMKTNNKNRKCKYGDCDKVVGKGKSYCKKCYVLKRRDEKRAKYIPVSEMTKEQHKEYTKKSREWKKNNKDKIEGYKEKQKQKDLERRKKIKVKCCECNVFIGTADKEYNRGDRKCDNCHRLARNRRMREYRKKPKNRLSSDVRTRVWQTLKGGKKHKSTFDALGYTPKQLMEHLEKYMEDGMNWDNYTKHGWHIDHTKPVDAFNFTSTEDEEFRECWKLSNLRPMWAEDNWSKNNKYEQKSE